VPDAVAAVLNIAQQPGKSLVDSIAATMEGRVRLLVFDNCEHLLDTVADLIEAVFAHSQTVRVLATSRRLDGIPLAIELAASRTLSMSVNEVRDRLDHRFRLLVGARRGLERHQTLRHAVAWSYDLLDDPERDLLDRCSVFAGGFDIESACAVADSDIIDGSDTFAVLDLLDALVRKSLLVADRSAGRTRFSMLETIRQFAEDQLVANGRAVEVRTVHARHFAGLEAEILALWDGPRQREAYEWFAVELANLRAAFRWAADQCDLDTAATIATYATMLGFALGSYELASWAEELIDSARACDHPRLARLYVMASQCWIVGRIEDAVRYSDAGQAVVAAGSEVVHGAEGWLGGVYQAIGQPDRMVQWCRAQLARGRDTHVLTQAGLVVALTTAGRSAEAMAAAEGMIDKAEATRNPYSLSFALLAYGYTFHDFDPPRALDAHRRGLAVANESGNRSNANHLTLNLSRLETTYGDPLAALDYVTDAIHDYHDAGNTNLACVAHAILVLLLARVELHEPAATIAGFAFSPLTAASLPELSDAVRHLREVVGDEAFESLSRAGEALTTPARVKYALDQIDRARLELAGVAPPG
jgi:predicted ATPase